MRNPLPTSMDPFADKFGTACFWLEKYRASPTADEKGIYNHWTAEGLWNVLRLELHFAAVVKLLGGPFTSCYRCPELNAAVGGVDDSDHQQGAALDTLPSNFDNVDDAAAAVLLAAQNGELGPVRQIIPEHKEGVVHVGWYTLGNNGPPAIVQDANY